ncbi:MAG: polysaccharide biosynthesis tyrosine autokinase [Hyphomicrobiales bacterium]
MKYDQLPAHLQSESTGMAPMPNGGYNDHRFNPYNAIEEDESSFDPLKLFWFAVHYRVMLVAFLIAAIVSAIFFNFLQTPQYGATAKLEISTTGAKVFQDLEVVSQTSDLRTFETAKQKMLSRELAKRVVFEMNLTEDAAFLAPTPKFSLTNITKRFTGGAHARNLDELSVEQREQLALNSIRNNLSISLIRNTSILAVNYRHPDRSVAANVANQVTQSYIDQSIDKKSQTSGVARDFIQQQVLQTKDKLQKSEKELVKYAEDAGITVTGSEVSLIGASIAEINSALSQAVQERLDAERFKAQITSGNASSLPDVFASGSIQTTNLKIAELRATYQENLSTLKPGFPEMIRLNAQINELQKQVNAEIRAIAKSVELKYEQSKAKEASLRLELADLEKQQSSYQRKNIKYTILKREVDSNRSQYESLITKLSDVGIGSKLRDASTTVVELAIPSTDPLSPNLLLNLVVSLALFTGLAVATVYILELMNNTFSVPDQLETELNLPILGVIPYTKESELLESFDNPNSALSEAYRTLRTSVQFTGTDSNIKSLMVTSSEPSEGKSTTAFRIAHDFAALGRKVLLIDADLRKPRMHRLFNTDAGIGLSNLLTNVVRGGDIVKIFRETDNPNITFLSAGTIPPNPSDLLVSQKMGLTIHYCTKKYDLVILDCPPVMGLSDAPIIARQVDATLVVVSSKQVTRKSAKNALKRLRAVGANVIGCAFTKFKVNQLDYNYSYRYMQYNYYSYEGEESQTAAIANNNNVENVPASHMANKFSRLASRFGLSAK